MFLKYFLLTCSLKIVFACALINSHLVISDDNSVYKPIEIKKICQGSWKSNEGIKEAFRINNDSIYFYNDKISSSKPFKYEISEETIFDGDTIQCQNGEYLFLIYNDKGIDLYYILQVTRKKLIIMDNRNGQIIKYSKKAE
ncbi:MAG: hypothetical protein RIR55_1839 [Bacteroidota bacterium]